MTSKKWYAKNSILASLLTRTLIIIIFVTFYNDPKAAGIVIVIIQAVYSIYILILLRFTKIRYFVVKTLSNILLAGIFIDVFAGAVSDINSGSW